MLKVDLYKLKTKNYFTGIKLELLPTEIVLRFHNKSFSFLCSEVIDYTYDLAKNQNIKIKLPGLHEPLDIGIKPYKHEDLIIICQHLDNYCKNKITYVVNPMYSR